MKIQIKNILVGLKKNDEKFTSDDDLYNSQPNQTNPIHIQEDEQKKNVVQGRISDRIFIYRSDHRNGKTFLKKQTKFSTKKQKKIELYSFDFVI